MFKKTADLLGNTDLPIVGTPKIFGNIAVNSDQEFPNLRNNGSCEFRVEIKKSTSPYNIITESFTFNSNTTYTLSAIVAYLNTLTSNLVFDSDEGCISVESAYSGHKAYIKILTKSTSSAFDPLPLMGLYADPHPASFSEAKDIESSPVSPATQGNKHGTTFIARKEDRLSSGVNRALAGVAMNSEHTQLQITKPIAIGIQIEVDASTHANRLHINSATNTYEYIYLGPNGNDSIDQALDGRRIFVGGLANSSNIREIEGAFLLKSTENRSLLSDSLDYIRVGAVVSNSSVQPGTTSISSPSFDSTGAVVSSTMLTDSQALYSDYGNVLGEDIAVHAATAVSSFTTSTIKTSTSISNAEVGFKVVVSGSNPSNYTNDGTYRITRVISDTEIEVEPVSSAEPKILNIQPNGSYSPTITISTGGEFIHYAILLFSPDLVFPSNGKILLSLYVESSIEECGASFQQETLQSRSLIVADYGLSLGSSFDGSNPDLESGYHISQQKRGIEIVSEGTLLQGSLGTREGPFTGEITSDWVLTAASGEFFYEDSLGALFRVDDKWARAISLVDFKKIQLSPFRKLDTISVNSSAIYYKYPEQNGSIHLPSSISTYGTSSPGYVFVGESSSSSGTRQKGFLHLTQITAAGDNTSLLGKTATTSAGSNFITLDFNPIESGVIHPVIPSSSPSPATLPTVVCISTGTSVGWYIVKTSTSTQIELTEFAANSGTLSLSDSETVNIHFFAQTLASQQLLQHNNGEAYSALTLHGESGRDHGNSSAANYGLAVSWNSEGGGILASANKNGLGGNGDGSTGYLFEGYLAPPASGIYLSMEGVSSASTNDLSGSDGLKIVSSSEAYNIENITTYRSQSSTPPKASIHVANTGGDSGLSVARGTLSSSWWDAALVDIRDTSDIYGAGGAMSLQGSWYSRYSSQIYLSNSDSVMSSPKFASPYLVGSLGHDGDNLYFKEGVAGDSAADYSMFKIPHGSVITIAETSVSSDYDLKSCPGRNILLDPDSSSYTGQKISTKILAVNRTSTHTYFAVEATPSDLTALPANYDVVVRTSFFSISGGFPNWTVFGADLTSSNGYEVSDNFYSPVVEKNGIAATSPIEGYLSITPNNFATNENAMVPDNMEISPGFVDGSMALPAANATVPTPSLGDTGGALASLQNPNRVSFGTDVFLDSVEYIRGESSISSDSLTPGGFDEASWTHSMLWPRTSASGVLGSYIPGGDPQSFAGTGSIGTKTIIGDPIVDPYFFRMPTPFPSGPGAYLQGNQDTPKRIRAMYAEPLLCLQINPIVEEDDSPFTIQYCKIVLSDIDSLHYSFAVTASLGRLVSGMPGYTSGDVITATIKVFLAGPHIQSNNMITLFTGTTHTLSTTSLFESITEQVRVSKIKELKNTSSYSKNSVIVALELNFSNSSISGTATYNYDPVFLRHLRVEHRSSFLNLGANVQAQGTMVAAQYKYNSWKEGAETISPAHVDLYAEDTAMTFASRPFGNGELYDEGRQGANGLGAVKTSSGHWLRPTYNREHFFSKGIRAATINLYHPFHDPAWYIMAAARSYSAAGDPTNFYQSFSTADGLLKRLPDHAQIITENYIPPGPTGFTIPLNPPHGAVLTSMDWNLWFSGVHVQGSTDAPMWCAFWASVPDSSDASAQITVSDVNSGDYLNGSTNFNHKMFSITHWNRMAGARVSLYRYNCMSENSISDQWGGSTVTPRPRLGAELIYSAIATIDNDPLSGEISNKQLFVGRQVRGSAKFNAEYVETFGTDLDQSYDNSVRVGPDSLSTQTSRFKVDRSRYAYFATITFYGGNRIQGSSGADFTEFRYNFRDLNGETYDQWLSDNSIGLGTLGRDKFDGYAYPYAPIEAGLHDYSTNGRYYGKMVNMGFTGFRISGPNYETDSTGPNYHFPHFNPKVQFRGFKLNWKTNKI